MLSSHLQQRIISAIWLGITACFFVNSLPSSLLNSHPNLFILPSLIVSLFFVLFGFFYAYQVLLLPADHVNKFMLRCVAGVWFGALCNLITMSITGKDYAFAQSNLVIPILVALSGFVVGFTYLYKILIFPKVNYIKLFPSLGQRIISALWFALSAYIIVSLKQDKMLSVFVLLLTSYLGFTYGYRILLLPTSIRAAVKSIMIGLIGVSYSLIIVLLMFCITFFLQDYFTPSHSADTSPLSASISVEFIMFPLIASVLGGTGILFSLALYLISRVCTFVAKLSHSR